ncbi:DUF4148 domain-containing protein [Bordetella avium]|uniref:Exported protein n=1 Tax=Bordetella avium (strain 197N) TaxID=360910 RepID=Q2L0M4_BORA1|nr:DUF4148 domain-containing protein [Bordetella avium]AZY52573.1 DUF4148 domain-containing protein [Bordetella avium]RIQ19265.1 DUF4148 domain-containing protein [Bordetella avium]RIQ33433.1 DUF4148 domain-containing protein [Bordetella avium]RIQ52834.1 DUF4148 domain-containing protein [Bordetella avium]RIQ71379.1 DUF4148 domain-containing protein [Bordetella avium]
MKTLSTAVLMSLTLLTAAAQASQNIEPNNIPYQGVYGQQDSQAKTRAQVAQELAQAKADGQYTTGELDYPPALAIQSGKSRAEVAQELAQAKAKGEYTFGELDYPPHANGF